MRRTNRFQNSRPFSTSGWTANTGTTVTYVNGTGPIPGITGYVESSRTTTGTRSINGVTPAPGKLGEPVTCSIYILSTVATTVSGTVYLQNSMSQSVGGYFFIPATVLAANKWTRIQITSAATNFPGSLTPSDHTHVSIGLSDQSTLATAKLRAAAVMVGTTGDYFDGDMPDVGSLARWWEGLPRLSSSTEASPLSATPNLEDATVTVEVNVDPSTSPRTMFSESAWQTFDNAGYFEWAGYSGLERLGAGFFWRTATPVSQVTRPITGFIVGRTYRVSFEAVRGSRLRTFGIVGKTAGIVPIGSGSWVHTVDVVATATSHTLFLGTVDGVSSTVLRVSIDLIPVGYIEGRFSLTRTDAAGTRPVRLLEGQALTDGALVVEDSEASMKGPVTYTLLTPAGEAITRSTTLEGSEGYRLHPVPFPQLAQTAGLVTGYDASRSSATTEHQVIGRPDPVVRLAGLRSRRGTLTLWCDSYESLRDLIGVYERTEVVLLRQPDYAGLDLYHACIEVREGPYDDGGKRWRLDVTYAEVGYPTGPLLGAQGWTWTDLVGAYPTWTAVVDAFPTWTAAQIGPT